MSQKYLREIEEILKQAREKEPAKGRRSQKSDVKKAEGGQWRRLFGWKLWSLSPGRIAVIAACVLISAIVFRAMVPGAAVPLFWAALILFIAAYALFLARPSLYEKRWRGRPVEDKRPPWRERLRKRLGR